MAEVLRRRLAAERPDRARVRALLGPGDFADRPELLSYHIGSYKPISLDCYTLDVTFDSTGRLLGAEIIQH